MAVQTKTTNFIKLTKSEKELKDAVDSFFESYEKLKHFESTTKNYIVLQEHAKLSKTLGALKAKIKALLPESIDKDSISIFDNRVSITFNNASDVIDEASIVSALKPSKKALEEFTDIHGNINYKGYLLKYHAKPGTRSTVIDVVDLR